MFKKLFVFLLVFFTLFISVNSVDITVCGQSISSNNYYILTQDITASGSNCLTVPNNSQNITIDLNGYSITGLGNKHGIYQAGNSHNVFNNLVVKNGLIKNFTNGFYYYSNGYNIYLDYEFKNMTFVSNSGTGIYLKSTGSYSKNVTISNSNFMSKLQIEAFSNVYLNDNVDFEDLHFISVGAVYLNDSLRNYVGFDKFILNSVGAMYGDSIGTRDLCHSTFTFIDGIKILLLNDSSATIDCLTVPAKSQNVVVDLNGYSIIGDGGSDGIYQPGNGHDTSHSLVVKNGFIKNFSNGFYYFSNGWNVYLDYVFDNVSFSSNSGNDIYVRANGAYSKNVSISNSNLLSTLRLDAVTNLYLVDNINFEDFIGSSITNLNLVDSLVDSVLFNSVALSSIINFVGDKVGVMDLCGSSISGTSNIYLKLFNDSSDSTICFNVPGNTQNVTIDLNGYNITGSGGSYGIYQLGNSQDTFNSLVVKNGFINDFSNGIYYYSDGYNVYLDYVFDNLSFFSNSGNDIYVRATGGYSKNVSVLNSDLLSILRLESVTNVYLVDNINFADFTGSSITSLNLAGGLKDYVLFNLVTLSSVSNFVGDKVGIMDLCGSTISGSSNIYLKLFNDSSDSSTCFTVPNNLQNVTIDLNGHNITGGGGSYGIYQSGNTHDASNGLVVKNGFINDFTNGFYYYSNGYNIYLDYVFENLSFFSNSGNDIYVRATGGYSKNVSVFNNDFTGLLNFQALTNLDYFLNNISSISDISRASVAINTSFDSGDGQIGNVWGDVTCPSGIVNNVTYGDYIYGVCVLDVYNSGNSFNDTFPIVSLVYDPVVIIPDVGSSSGASTVKLPFAEDLSLMIFSLLLIFSYLFA